VKSISYQEFSDRFLA